VLDLEAPDLEMRPRGRRRGVFVPPPPREGCYAISALDGSIATSLLGPRASFPCGDESYNAISALDGSIATSLLGPHATYPHN
jgi:hypothetical protein